MYVSANGKLKNYSSFLVVISDTITTTAFMLVTYNHKKHGTNGGWRPVMSQETQQTLNTEVKQNKLSSLSQLHITTNKKLCYCKQNTQCPCQ